jgi:hypothetical protein
MNSPVLYAAQHATPHLRFDKRPASGLFGLLGTDEEFLRKITLSLAIQ